MVISQSLLIHPSTLKTRVSVVTRGSTVRSVTGIFGTPPEPEGEGGSLLLYRREGWHHHISSDPPLCPESDDGSSLLWCEKVGRYYSHLCMFLSQLCEDEEIRFLQITFRSCVSERVFLVPQGLDSTVTSDSWLEDGDGPLLLHYKMVGWKGRSHHSLFRSILFQIYSKSEHCITKFLGVKLSFSEQYGSWSF